MADSEDSNSETDVLGKDATEVLKVAINNILDEGVSNLVLIADTKKGPAFVNITKNNDELIGKLTRCIFNNLLYFDEDGGVEGGEPLV